MPAAARVRQRSARGRRGDQAGRGERDGTGEFWWIEARNFRAFADELRRVADLFSGR